MPAAFDRCVKNGGKVRTRKISSDKYQHICYKDGEIHEGYVKTKKSKKRGKKLN